MAVARHAAPDPGGRADDAPQEPARGSEPSSPEVAAAPAGLSDRDREMLAFERQWWKYAGGKDQAVRELFGMSSTRYYQVLNSLIDRPEALAHDAMLVKRLRRMRETRRRSRSARPVAPQAEPQD